MRRDYVWVLFDRREFVGVFETREAACDYFTQLMAKRKINIGWIQETLSTWIVEPKYEVGRVTVSRFEVRS